MPAYAVICDVTKQEISEEDLVFYEGFGTYTRCHKDYEDEMMSAWDTVLDVHNEEKVAYETAVKDDIDEWKNSGKLPK